MSVDFGMSFQNAEMHGEELHLLSRMEPHTLILFNALSTVSFVFKVFIDDVLKGTYKVGALTDHTRNTGNDGDCTVFALYFTCDEQMKPFADDAKTVYYDDPEQVKVVRGEFTSSQGERLDGEMKVRFA